MPIWTAEQRQEHRDAVFAGRVESTVPVYEVEVPLAPGNKPPEQAGSYTEVVWVARVRVLDIRKGHPLLEAGPVVDVFFRRGKQTGRWPPYPQLAAGDEGLLYALVRGHPAADREVLEIELRSDFEPWDGQAPRVGKELVEGSWVELGVYDSRPTLRSPIRFEASGRVAAEHPLSPSRSFGYAEHWQVTPDGTLLLRSSTGHRFRLERKSEDVFISSSENQEDLPKLWVVRGPSGATP